MTANDLIGKSVSFDHPDLQAVCPPMPSEKRLVGVVTEAKPNGRTLRGAIPDFLVTVRGASGATKTVSYVETYMRITS